MNVLQAVILVRGPGERRDCDSLLMAIVDDPEEGAEIVDAAGVVLARAIRGPLARLGWNVTHDGVLRIDAERTIISFARPS